MPVAAVPLAAAAAAFPNPTVAEAPSSTPALLDTFERVQHVLRANDQVEAVLCLKAQHGVLVGVALIDLNHTVDLLNRLAARAASHYGEGMRSLANGAVRAAGIMMTDGATQLVSGSVQTAWDWGTWPARKTLALLLAPLYALADPVALPSLAKTPD